MSLFLSPSISLSITPSVPGLFRFEVDYVLSEPSESWTGRRGRVEASMLTDFLVRPEGSKCLVCVCRPIAFTELAVG